MNVFKNIVKDYRVQMLTYYIYASWFETRHYNQSPTNTLPLAIRIRSQWWLNRFGFYSEIPYDKSHNTNQFARSRTVKGQFCRGGGLSSGLQLPKTTSIASCWTSSPVAPPNSGCQWSVATATMTWMRESELSGFPDSMRREWEEEER